MGARLAEKFGVVCDKDGCGSSNVIGRGFTKGGKKTFQCNDCSKYFSVSPDDLKDGIGDVSGDKSVYRETDDAIAIAYSSAEPVTRDQLIEKFQIDMDVWKIKEFEVKQSQGYRKDRKVRWEVKNGTVIDGEVNDSGKMLVVDLFHVRTKFVRRGADDLSFADIDRFWSSFRFSSRPKIKVRKKSGGGRILELVLADLHIGNSTLDIAKRCAYVIDDVLAEVDFMEIEKIYLVLLGDTFHYDTFNRATANGTVVEAGMSPYVMYDSGVRILIDTINSLAKVAPVEVVGVYGNHDRMMAYALLSGLSMYYKDIPDISVDATHDSTKSAEFGNCLVVWHHGDMNRTRLDSLVYRDEREAFGRTKYAELHTGHFHHQKADENSGGVIIRVLPTITGRTEWEGLNGFNGLRSSMAFVWDKELGLKQVIHSNL